MSRSPPDEVLSRMDERQLVTPTEDVEETADMVLDLALPPDDDLQQDTRIYTPPPRIAARFYRPSHARRKGSAASSRRGSISSAQSRSSVQAAVDQSKLVAQHLRRATFLDERRARLADRAAHVEKVRLRAALTKAAPRSATASEERAAAAQQARERVLADIVASCSEEVKRAKQVAGMMKDKREQDLSKMKAQMAERMAEAERRREELRQRTAAMRRSRGHSVAARKSMETIPQLKEQDEPLMALSEDAAVVRLQGWWRGVIRRRAMHEFNGLGLSVDGIRDTLFETVVDLLAQEKVLHITARLLRICGLHEGESRSVEEMVAVRTFLSAFLILGHPNQVLSTKNETEGDAMGAHRLPQADLDNPQLQDLISKAKDVLVCFETILARLTAANRYTMPPALVQALPEAYALFHNAFIAWKARDSNAIIEVMLMQFVELDAVFHTVKDTTDQAVAELYKQSIRENQMLLIVRIKKLAGQEKGKKLIWDAVREGRKSRAKKKPTGDSRPRVAVEGEASATTESIVGSSPRRKQRQTSQPLTPPRTPASGSATKVAVKGSLSGLIPDNRIVVHELAINKEYQMPVEEYKKEQAAMVRPLLAEWRAVIAAHDERAVFQVFIVLAVAVKEKLQRLLVPGNSIYTMIEEMFDPVLAQRHFEMGSFSYEKFFTAVGNLLPKLCAPIRDDEVKDLAENRISADGGDIATRFEALNGFIDAMRCDHANFQLRLAAPQLLEAAVPYEIKRFAEDMENGQSLTAAETAWKAARSKVMAEVQRRDPEGVNHPKSRPTFSRYYAQLLVDLFTQSAPIDRYTVPEMLQLDMRRMDTVSTTIRRIVTVGAVLIQCKNILKRDVRSPWKTEAGRIMTVLEAQHPSLNTTIDGTMAALESGRTMPAATKARLRALVSKVLSASRDMSSSEEPHEPVLKLLLSRLRGNILARLTPGTASEKVRATTQSGEKLASLGLSEFVERVRGISDLLVKVGEVDRAAHGQWWDAVAAKEEASS